MSAVLSAADRLNHLFRAWRDAGVESCVWKSADRWEESVNGRTDLDVLVHAAHLDQARACLREQGWIELQAESWRSFPGLSDFVSSRAGITHHLHLHTSIVSGEKLVKSLRPPLQNLYFNMREMHENQDIPFVAPALELVMLIPRTLLKLNWIDVVGAVRRRSRRAVFRRYIGEYIELKRRCSKADVEMVLSRPELAVLPKPDMLLAFDDLEKLSFRSILRIRQAVAPWRNGTTLGRVWQGRMRRLARRREGVGKRLLSSGLSVAIVGPDGSGKTTLTAEYGKALGRHFRVQRFYMGSNRQEAGLLRRMILDLSWWPYLLVRKLGKVLSLKGVVAGLERGYKRLDDGLSRREKRQRLQRADKLVENGGIALFERYPLFHPYGDDCVPSLNAPPPDMLVSLQTSTVDIIARRPENQPQLLQAKAAAFTAFTEAYHANVICLSGNDSVSAWVTELLDSLHSQLLNRQVESGETS